MKTAKKDTWIADDWKFILRLLLVAIVIIALLVILFE